MKGALLAALLLAGCTAQATGRAAQPSCGPAEQPWMRAELFFGLAREGAPDVSALEWAGFMANTVTPRFPDGLTVLDGKGQWRNPATGRIGSESSKVLLIAAPVAAGTTQRLYEIAEAYDHRFGQQSVALIANRACVGFIGPGPPPQ